LEKLAMRTSGSLIRLIHFLVLLLPGLVAGATFGIWQGYDPRGLDAAAFVAVHQEAVRGLNALLPALGIGSVVLVGIGAWLARKERPTMWLFLLALLCMAAGGIITRFFNQTINAEVIGWTATTVPANWTALRASWWNWHIVRTLFALAGFALSIAAVLWHRPGAEQ
jgi:hypothetical protein